MDYIIRHSIAYVKDIMLFFHGLQRERDKFNYVNNINELSNISPFFCPEKGLDRLGNYGRNDCTD